MPNPPMAKASIDTMRSLTPRELDTILVALQLLREADTVAVENARRWSDHPGAAILCDLDIETLRYELSQARKVSVCRSNP